METSELICKALHLLQLTYHQTKVPTAPPFNVAGNSFPWNFTEKVFDAEPSFNTISTFFPSAVLKATLGNPGNKLEPIRNEPGLTNFEAWATMPPEVGLAEGD